MKALAAVGLVCLAWTGAGAGELVFTNGSRLAGELSNEALMLSTGSGLVEVAPDEVVALTPVEVRLRDGRIVRGTLVGGQIKARTALGEIAVKVEELEGYHATPPPAVAAAPAALPPPAMATTARPSGDAAPPAAAGAGPSVTGGLAPMAAYQQLPPAPVPATTGPGPTLQPMLQPAALIRQDPVAPAPGVRLEVVEATPLYRDAISNASQVGRVSAGQRVTWLDSIDRRLRILNRLVFDGGHWVKVRVAEGVEGWIPAVSVREVQ
jgi:hypothetical protein